MNSMLRVTTLSSMSATFTGAAAGIVGSWLVNTFLIIFSSSISNVKTVPFFVTVKLNLVPSAIAVPSMFETKVAPAGGLVMKSRGKFLIPEPESPGSTVSVLLGTSALKTTAFLSNRPGEEVSTPQSIVQSLGNDLL
ncbi:hypothetical protein ASSaV_gp25 [Abalone shriveling syndrome-associated virus]|uniref:hypothetical protein n=1 Tax=Abalone shriveling syndrome-associated virus TaxID=491893 RepID=UPI0001881BAB|nr:hypothetical protein ASSaV_gp25 [Abalone shriveling syndrome-associated virus]ACJ71980.1 unknown [Abalone shriveling syndrome-associated virus]